MGWTCRRRAWLWLWLAAAGCAHSAGTQVVPASELPEGGGRPAITAIVDRGGGDIPSVGRITPVTQDGYAVVGEALLVEGRNFGRQPTVYVAGRPATVVSRTEDGGILLRVPPGTPAGTQILSVAQESGRAERALLIRRLAVARTETGLIWLDVGASGLTRLGRVDIKAVKAIVFSPDGRASYGLTEDGTLHVFEMPATGLPSARGHVAVEGPVRGLFAAAQSKRLIVLGQEEVALIDISLPLHPRMGRRFALPSWAQGKRVPRAALSPDGRHLAIATTDRNRVVLFAIDDLATSREPPRVELSLLPGVLAPAIADVTFSPDGRTLWLVSGVTAESRALGPLPTRVHALRLETGTAPKMTEARVVEIEGATGPVAIVTGRLQPLVSGAAIRIPPEKAMVHVAAYGKADGHPGVFSVGPDDAARTALTDRRAGAIGRPEVSPDEAWLLAPCGDKESGWRVLGVSLTTAGTPTALPIGPDSGHAGGPIELRVQP